MVLLPPGHALAPPFFLTNRDAIGRIKDGMPRISEELLNGVVFLYQTVEQAAKNERIGGTGFVLAKPAPRASEALGQEVAIPFLVSNRHVVWEGSACVPRFNLRHGDPEGQGWILDLDQERWVPHPDGIDLAAACIFGLLDRVRVDVSCVAYENLLSEEMAAAADIGPGDEVFMIGRFANHQGKERIKPAVRFGNISMGPEPIWHSDYNRDELSYAVEMRSRTGFSGSPVVVYRTPATFPLKKLPEGHETGWSVLGVNWGFIYDDDGENSWLNGVIPAWKVLELMETAPLRKAFEKADAHMAGMKGKGGATSAFLSPKSEPPTTADNPSHEEDFNRLLGAAAKKRK